MKVENENGKSKVDDNQNKKKKIKSIILVGAIIVILSGVTLYYQYSQPTIQTDPYIEVDFSDFEASVANGKTYFYEVGDMDNIISHKIMDLNGSYYEMGYAHGQLLGNYIKFSVSYAFNTIFQNNKENYDAFTQENGLYYILNYAIFNDTFHIQELNAIVDASIDSSHDMYVPALGRDWKLIDLIVLNTIQDINQDLGSEFCSGFGIWGPSSADGEITIARTLDFPTDTNALITQLSIIAIYRGNDSIQNDLVTFTYPGIIGAISGFNDKGVWLSTDNSNGIKTVESDRTPMGIVMRNFLEQSSGGAGTLEEAQQFFLDASPYVPFIFLIGFNSTGENPVAVLEGNDNEVIIRRGSDEGFENYVFLTNHQRILSEPLSCNRWNLYVNNFELYLSTGDQTIDWEESIAILKEGGGKSSIQSILFRPSTLEFSFGSNYVEYAKNGTNWDYNRHLRGAGRNPALNYTISFFSLS